MRASTGARLAALGALVLGAAAVVLAVDVAVHDSPRGLVAAACALAGATVCWYGVLRRGLPRLAGIGAGLALLGAAVVVLLGEDTVAVIAIVVLAALAMAAARAAFRERVELAPAPAPRRPVLLYNPRSGGGTARRLDLAGQARARGIEPVELQPGDDLEALARAAVAGGADALAMAGGDGSQAIVAAVAAEHGLPYACVPAGTRNHFALDLGVDRDDVIGALDALTAGGERRADLAEVNGRVFVNNVSLGVYATAVQRAGYRDAKLRTLLDVMPETAGPDGAVAALRWTGPGGHEHGSARTILVSNNPYRLGRALGSGTRPRLDAGRLGIAVVGAGRPEGAARGVPHRPWRAWDATAFEVRSDRPIPAGVDGEAVELAAPLRFGIRPGALRVRIAPGHPGASPSARLPEGLLDTLAGLAALALGRPRPEAPVSRA